MPVKRQKAKGRSICEINNWKKANLRKWKSEISKIRIPAQLNHDDKKGVSEWY